MSDVRFYSRSSIRFARCDCIEGTLCEHVVLAVQAFVQAKAQQAEFNHLIWQMRSEHVTSSTIRLPAKRATRVVNMFSN